MRAWLVVNAFLHSGKFSEIHEWLRKAAVLHGIEIEEKTNAELISRIDVTNPEASEIFARKNRPDFVIFWDKDVRLARLLERVGLKLYNCADAIAVCDDKSLTHERLIDCGIHMPKTVFAPLTYPVCGFREADFLQDVEKLLGFPMVVKEDFGSFGAQVYLAKDHEELLELIAGIGNVPFLFQEFIGESRGKDIRINMVGDTAVACMMRYNDHDFRANITNGGNMRAYEPTEKELAMARKVMKELRLDFAGVDILFGRDREPILCEVNSNAHFKNIFDCTGVNVADAIMEYILEKNSGNL